MPKFARYIAWIAGLTFFVVLDIGLSFVLPYPWSKVNMLFALLIVLMLWRNTGWVVLASFFAHLITELYTISPFGVVLLSGTLSILFSLWLYRYFFTNHSWYAAITLSAVALAIFRAMYTMSLLVLRAFNVIKTAPWKLMFITFAWEGVFTIFAVGVIYFAISRFSNRFRSAVITARRFSV